MGWTYPEAGVIATRPATHPDAAPRTVGFFRWNHSAKTHDSVAAAAARWVATKALVESSPTARALPALKPNQPNHRMAAPRTVIGRLCGAMLSIPNPLRLPTAIAAARAETPEVMWTTVPPAKSRAPRLRIHPPIPHTQWATGLYTSNAHSRLKTRKAEKRNRSANAPVISAGVMTANIIW